MKRILCVCVALLYACIAYSQHTITLIIKGPGNLPLTGASVMMPALQKAIIADSAGIVHFTAIPAGVYEVRISYAGMKEQSLRVTAPQSAPVTVTMEENEEAETEDVVVTATRISRTIANIPTRIEIISGEELAEKGNMKPGDIRMLLNESTGIQTQQTSATSYNAGIRIQGLDGRYTQLLRDGYPLYAGFSGGLSILQVAPLDLRQVEVIKGAASTLYGGGAIAGLVNLVSKTPGAERELDFLANATTAGGIDLSGFYSERYGRAGLTVFASRNSNGPFDPAGIGFTAIPKFHRYTVNPRLFLYGNRTNADIGISLVTENRTGGSVDYIRNGGQGFFEKNTTDRITTQAGITHRLGDGMALQLRNSYTRFNRVIRIPGYVFDALQQSSFSEFSWSRKGETTDWVIGANVLTDDLAEKGITTDPKRDYHLNTYGLFLQNAWTINERLVLETGVRGDHVSGYGFEWLPRVSTMIRISPKLTTRIGGGYGYKAPTIFTEEAERIQFRNVMPVTPGMLRNERSSGGNWDINYRTTLGAIGISINHLFFYTRLKHPLVMETVNGKLQFRNSAGHLDTKGMETNIRLTWDHFKLFAGYTYTDATTHTNSAKQWLPLTAKHRLNNVLMYEVEEKLKLGLEAYYYSRQQLTDGSYGRPYWIAGFMAEKLWEKFSLFINFENFTDTRQTKFDAIYTGAVSNPVFRDIYAPVEGFVVNGGIKIRW